MASTESTHMLCKLLTVQSAKDVSMDCFDVNFLDHHYFRALFKEIIQSKVKDPRDRLTRLIKYTVGDARDLIKH